MSFKINNVIIPPEGDPTSEYERGIPEVKVSGNGVADVVNLEQEGKTITLHVNQIAVLLPLLQSTQ